MANLAAPLPLAAGGPGIAAVPAALAPLAPSTAGLCRGPRALVLAAVRAALAARRPLSPAAACCSRCCLLACCLRLGVAGRALTAAALPLVTLLLPACCAGQLVTARPLGLALPGCRLLGRASATAAVAGAAIARRESRSVGAQTAASALCAATLALPLHAPRLLRLLLVAPSLLVARGRPRRAVVTPATALATPLPLAAGSCSSGLLAAAPHVGGAARVLELVGAKACRGVGAGAGGVGSAGQREGGAARTNRRLEWGSLATRSQQLASRTQHHRPPSAVHQPGGGPSARSSRRRSRSRCSRCSRCSRAGSSRRALRAAPRPGGSEGPLLLSVVRLASPPSLPPSALAEGCLAAGGFEAPSLGLPPSDAAAAPLEAAGRAGRFLGGRPAYSSRVATMALQWGGWGLGAGAGAG